VNSRYCSNSNLLLKKTNINVQSNIKESLFGTPLISNIILQFNVAKYNVRWRGLNSLCAFSFVSVVFFFCYYL